MNDQNCSLFDIMGPVMVGPSSSHTAGVLKLARMARFIMSDPIKKAEIVFYGSLAYTQKGHGSDKAVIAGLLGMDMDDEDIGQSFEIAALQQLEFRFVSNFELPEHFHPNTMTLILETAHKKMEIRGASIGGGNIEVQNIDDYEVSLSGDYETLLVWHHDVIGVIARVSESLARHSINIAAITSHRKEKGEEALLVIQVDSEVGSHIQDEIKSFHSVYRVLYIPNIFAGVLT